MYQEVCMGAVWASTGEGMSSCGYTSITPHNSCTDYQSNIGSTARWQEKIYIIHTLTVKREGLTLE